ncbi:Mobile element protein [Caballeronia sordidicola]|uniref:Mobile element protein n=1 Tax=Caballeronia sordidicola TaxID=196367 RepID=A0A242MYE9_CABSO|nr:Mobile element protein [Caballeronia sordidicola]
MDLPEHRTTDFVEDEGRVTRSGTFTVDNSLYSAPSRLIGHRLKVRLYSDRLDCYLSGALVHSTARVRRTSAGRGCAIPDSQLKLPHLWSRKFPHPVQQD